MISTESAYYILFHPRASLVDVTALDVPEIQGASDMCVLDLRRRQVSGTSGGWGEGVVLLYSLSFALAATLVEETRNLNRRDQKCE